MFALTRFLLPLLACSTAACVLPPTAQELLDVGFRTPEQTFATFQTAFAGDHIDLEYSCLSSEFKLANDIDGMTYRLGREVLFEENPFIKLLTRAEVIASTALDDRHHELVAELDSLFAHRTFRIFLVREDYFETWRGDRLAFNDYKPFDESVFGDDGDGSGQLTLYAVIDVPFGETLDGITEVRVGQEWRIAGFELVEADSSTVRAP